MPNQRRAFCWTEDYSVHIAILDHQHQELFAAVDELNRALSAGEGTTAVEPVLAKLVEYAALHFAAEESLMARHEFPGLASHRLQHEMFREKIVAFLDAHRAGKPGVPVALLFYMQTWLTGHVLKVDQRYSAFLNARGVH